MGFSVYFQQPAQVQMGVFLGSGKAPVSQEFLDSPEVRPPAEQMGSKRMPQRVRADFAKDSNLLETGLDQSLH